MNKKILTKVALISTFLLIAILFLFENHDAGENRVSFSLLQVDDLGTIIDNRIETDSVFEEICFNDIPLFYDKSNNCFYYSLQENSEEAYNPIVSWKSGNIKIAIENIDISDDSISSNTEISFILYDKNHFSKKALKCTTLPLINIDKFSNDFNFNYDNAVITIYDNREGEKEQYNSYKGKVRIRGGQTSELPKPGLRIELDKVLKGDNNTNEKYYDLFGLEADNEFVLYTCNIEKDHIRNVFSTNLWYETCADDNDFGFILGMSYRLCEVFLNNNYWGLCAIGNPISKKRNYVDLNKDSDKYPLENIYKLNFFGDRERMDYELYGNDYLFSIKTNEDNPEAWQPFIDYMQLLLYSDDFEKLKKSVDIDNAIDIYLFYNMIQAWDNAWFEDNLKFRNTYLVSKVMEDQSIKMLYIPWDLDRTWGHCREDGLEYPMDYTSNYDMVMTPLENLVNMDDEETKTLIYDKYLKLRSEKWSDQNIMEMLNKYEKQVYGSGAFFRDTARWPDNYHDNNTDLRKFKEYVLLRIHFFDEYIKNKFS